MTQRSKISNFMGRIKRLFKNESGGTAMMLGVAMVPITLAVGVAVDYGNQIDALARLQASTDSAVLAAGRDFKKSESDLQKIADQYFHTNFGKPANAWGQKIVLTKGEDCVTVRSEVRVKNLFMKLENKGQGVLRSDAEVCAAKTGMELVLVFDNTGSMNSYGRMRALKKASKHLTDILFGDDTTSDTLKIGIVPFAEAVNVGSWNRNKSWLDTRGKSPMSRLNFSHPNWHNWLAWHYVLNRDWNGCVEARAGDLAWNDTAPSLSNPASLFTPMLNPDEPGRANSRYYGRNYYTNSYLDDGRPRDRSLDGLQRYQGKYYRSYVRSSSRGPGVTCDNVAPITPLTGDKKKILKGLDAMRTSGSTHIAEGVAWGTRVISPGEPFTEGGPYHNRKMPKIMILLTDGENTVPSGYNHNKSRYTTYGYLAQKRLGTDNRYTSVRKQNELVKKSCEFAKKQGIIVYTFAYQVRSSTARSLIKNCASDPEKYFDPPTNDQLFKYFEQIADELRGLYLSK